MAKLNLTLRTFNGSEWVEQHVKTNIQQVEGLSDSLSTLDAIARGASRAKVFDTLVDLDAWLAVPGNTATLQVGDNLYVKDTDVPDFWWDGTAKQKLEGEKIVLALASTAMDGLMSKGDKSKLDGVAANATRVTLPSDIGAATAAQGAKADSAYQKPGGGIPKADLSTEVRESLAKAESAAAGGSVFVGATAPAAVKVGDIWYDTSGN